MAGKYKRKIKKEPVEHKESPDGDENSLLRESAKQIKRHEELTGINRAMWDELLKERVKNAKLQAAIDASYR